MRNLLNIHKIELNIKQPVGIVDVVRQIMSFSSIRQIYRDCNIFGFIFRFVYGP